MRTTQFTIRGSICLSLFVGASALAGCGTRTVSAPIEPGAIPARATVTASEQAAPPSYTMKFDGLQLVVDAKAVVQGSSMGTVVLRSSSGLPAGDEWKVFDETQRCCQTFVFSEIDSLYRTGAPIDSGSIAIPQNLSIPWNRFGLLDKTLPSTRFLVIKHTSDGGLASYQLFDIFFPAPNG